MEKLKPKRTNFYHHANLKCTIEDEEGSDDMSSDPSFESADYEESKNVKKFVDKNSIENTDHELVDDISKYFIPLLTIFKVL